MARFVLRSLSAVLRVALRATEALSAPAPRVVRFGGDEARAVLSVACGLSDAAQVFGPAEQHSTTGRFARGVAGFMVPRPR